MTNGNRAKTEANTVSQRDIANFDTFVNNGQSGDTMTDYGKQLVGGWRSETLN